MANTKTHKDDDKAKPKSVEETRAEREQFEKDRQKKADEASKLRAQAQKDRIAADEAANAVRDGKLSPEQKKYEDAWQKSVDSDAKAAEAERAVSSKYLAATVEDAKVVGYGIPENLSAASNRAQKKGNDPANPLPAPGLGDKHHINDMVHLSRKTPDVPELVHAMCHKDMVGDYLRAGWNVDASKMVDPEAVDADEDGLVVDENAAADPATPVVR